MNRILNISTSLFSFLRKVGLIVLCTLYSVLSFSQNFPVQVIPQALPPAPIYVSNYADASTVSSPLRVQIILNDFEIANREIRLKTYFTGSGLSFQSNDIVVGASPLFLEGGIPLILTNVELAPYFEFNNITGINASQYGNAIPEGAYQFCVEVYDVLTGSRLSNKSCAVSVVFQNEPPFLVLPRNKINVDETNPQYIVFQWTPRSINVSNVEYELSLVEIWDTQVDPQQAFLSSPPVFQTTTSATTYVYGPADPLLLSGKNYAWRIQAKAKQGIEEIGLFKNQGYSEIFSFSYAGACNLPLVINHEVKGSTNANIFWDDFSTEIPEFTIRYRQKNVQDAEWFLGKTTTNDHTIWDLKAGTTYEYQLSKSCGITQSDWSFTKEFTTALEFEEESVLDCGVSPDINLTNMQPLASIGTGATFKAGDFPVKILEVSGANGRFTGKGYVTLPYLKNIKVAVEFTNILINTDTEMAEGSVRTAYDADWGNILDTGDVVDVLDDVQDVFTGGDFTEYDVDFEINSANDIKIEGGEIIITGPNGETKTFDHDDGDTYQIKDASGDTYNVDEDGNITKGAEAAEGGEATAQNTDGISGGSGTADAPSVNEITANGVTVTFKKSSNTKYDLDIADSDFERSKYPKTQSASGTDYYPVHKAVVDGQTDEFLAEISISNSNISIDDLVVKTVSGLKIDTRKEENSNLIISLKGINSYRSEEAIVTYKDEEGKYKIAASFFIHHIKQQELVNVVVVSVNGTNQLANIEQELNSIFGKAGAQFKVSTDTFSLEGSDWDDNNNGKLDYDGSGLLSDYPKELKNIQQKYKQNKPSWDAKAYHLFLLPNNISLTKPLSGFMPKTRQWGYIFNAHTNDALENKSSQNLVAAHELGHGVFKLAHPFQNAENKSGSGSNWLMDYNNGDQLPYAHWAAMSDESLQLFLFQEEEDSEIAGKIWFTPEWKPFSYTKEQTYTIYVGNVNSKHVDGTVPGFALNGKTYYADYDNNGKFLGYKSNSAGTIQNIPYTSIPKDTDKVNIFKNNGGCGKDSYYTITYKYYKDNFSSQNFLELLSNGTIIKCSYDLYKLCQKGKEYFNQYESSTSSESEKNFLFKTSELICEAGSSQLVEAQKKQYEEWEATAKTIAGNINLTFSWEKYYDALLTLSEWRQNGITSLLENSSPANKPLRDLIFEIAFKVNKDVLALIPLDQKVGMLVHMLDGKLYNLFTTNHDALVTKVVASVKNSEASEFLDILISPNYKNSDGEPLIYVLKTKLSDFLNPLNPYTSFFTEINRLSNSRNLRADSKQDVKVYLNWDVEQKDYVLVSFVNNKNNYELVYDNSNHTVGIKTCLEYEYKYPNGLQPGTVQRVCKTEGFYLPEGSSPFDIVGLTIINDVSPFGAGCLDGQATEANSYCGTVQHVPAIFLDYLQENEQNQRLENFGWNVFNVAITISTLGEGAVAISAIRGAAAGQKLYVAGKNAFTLLDFTYTVADLSFQAANVDMPKAWTWVGYAFAAKGGYDLLKNGGARGVGHLKKLIREGNDAEVKNIIERLGVSNKNGDVLTVNEVKTFVDKAELEIKSGGNPEIEAEFNKGLNAEGNTSIGVTGIKEIDDFLATAPKIDDIAPSSVPNGYEIITRNNSKYIRRKVASNPDTPRLMVDETGTIVQYVKPQRLASNSKLRNRLIEANGGIVPPNHQAHHIVSDNVIKNSPLHQEAIKRGLYDIDRVSNGKLLAETDGDYITGFSSEAYPTHYGSHPKYDDAINAQIDDLIETNDIDIFNISKEDLSDEALINIINAIENRATNVLTNWQASKLN